MPAPVQDIIVTPTVAPIVVSIEPAVNAIHTLLILAKNEGLSGFGEWITETVLSMSSFERRRHRLVMIGLFFAVKPKRSWPSFPAYVEHLAAMTPLELRDKLLDAYINLPCLDVDESAEPVDKNAILASVDAFLDFLRGRFSPEHIDDELETHAYAYIMDPPTMKNMIVSHLSHMWDDYLAAEWARVQPMLEEAVDAFGQVDFRGMSKLEAAQFVTGQPLVEGHWARMLEKTEQLVFVPSAHVGSHLGKFKLDDSTAVVFAAHLPEGVQLHAPELSRADILVRLGALADDTRLQILRLLAEKGEMRSQEIISSLDLSQSAASRHLSQLTAAGYLSARRCEGSKCYRINPERLERTLDAVSAFLQT
jgi:DNA-binding transcriptional ArsR family regulator